MSTWKEEVFCEECGSSALCKVLLCETRTENSKYKGHCLCCFVHLFPGEHLIHNYKMRETIVATYLKEKFHDVTWRCDRQIEGGCSRRRLDLFLDMGSHVLIVQVDENKHDEYDCTSENRRLIEISRDLHHRHIVMIRFNPDGYVDPEKG